MLGLASETGSILDSYKRYLRDAIDLDHNREFLRVELGDLLWYLVIVATACGLEVSQIARANLANAARVASKKKTSNGISCFVPSQSADPAAVIVSFSDYQAKASAFSHQNLRGPEGLLAPLCGLSAAVGNILTLPRGTSGALELRKHQKFFLKELGDLLWYISAVATASNLNLGDIAAANLVRAGDLYPVSTTPVEALLNLEPKVGLPAKATESFPRILIVRFEEQVTNDGPTATQMVVKAIPNAFPKGPIKKNGGKHQGFKIGAHLGNHTTDNARRADGYRYHDAIHMGFMAVLGWSPTMRDLLRVKRKSQRNKDRDEDGARANYTEEGLAAILARLAPRRMNFLGENSVDGEVIATVKALIRDTEVENVPGWLWRRAISQGFVAMRSLDQNKGGYLIANLDRRELTYTKMDISNAVPKIRNKDATRAKR